MEFDANNRLVAKETSTKLACVKKSKEENKIKLDNIELEANEDIMSMIYWKALKEKMENRTPRQKQRERRRSKTKNVEKSCESSSDAEIGELQLLRHKVDKYVPSKIRETILNRTCKLDENICSMLKSERTDNDQDQIPEKSKNDKRKQLQRFKTVEKSSESSSDAEISDIMKSHLFKQKVEEHIPEESKNSKIQHLKRYSPRLPNKLLPLDEIQSIECDHHDDFLEPRTGSNNCHLERNMHLNMLPTSATQPISNSSKLIRELKFLSTDDPVPSPAPEVDKKRIVETQKVAKLVNGKHKLKDLINKSKNYVIDENSEVQSSENFSIKTPKNTELYNNSKKPLAQINRFDHFRKTRSSAHFENIPEVIVEKRVEKRTHSDPTSVHEQDDSIANEVMKRNLNISKTAKKHLGMAVTPIERSEEDEETNLNSLLLLDDRKEESIKIDMKSFVHALHISSDDTLPKLQDENKEDNLESIPDDGFRNFAQALQISSDGTPSKSFLSRDDRSLKSTPLIPDADSSIDQKLVFNGDV